MATAAAARVAIALTFAVWGVAAEAQHAPIRDDLPLAAAIDELRRAGASIVYSSALIEPWMRVIAAPASRDPLRAAAEIVSPYGLELRRIHADLHAVVRAKRVPRSAIRGQVIDGVSGDPIAGARIEVIGARQVGWSNADGGFAIGGLAPGRHAVQVSAQGYASQTVTRTIPTRDRRALTVALDDSGEDVGEVIVTASRYTYALASDASLFTLSAADIRAQPTLGEDALQSVARLPGIALAGVSARPNVRGGELGETLVLLDEMPLRQAFHLPGYNNVFSILDEELISRIDIYTGAVPPRFGNRLSGILDFASRSPDEPERHALGVSVFNAKARTAGRSAARDLEWLAAGRVGTSRPFIEDYAPDIGVPSYDDVFAKVAWGDPTKTHVQLNALGSSDGLSYFDPDSGETAQLDSRTRYGWLTANRRVNDRLRADALVGYSSIDTRRTGALAGDLVSLGALTDSRSSAHWDVRLKAEWMPAERHVVEAGVAATWGDARYDYASSVQFEETAAELFSREPAFTRMTQLGASHSRVGLFVSDRWRLADRFWADLGLRLEHERDPGDVERTFLSPRVSLRFDLGARTLLRASWARMHQSDDLLELQVEDGFADFQPAQRADHFILGLEQRTASGIGLRLEAFRKELDRPRTRFENIFDLLLFLPELSPDRVRVAPEASDLRGIELSGQWEDGPWTLWGAYTWSDFRDRVDGRDVARSWDHKHTVSVAAAWHRGPWTISTAAAVRRGRPTTPIDTSVPDSPTLGERNSQRLAHHASMDLRVTREFRVSRGRLVAYAQATNVFNRRNPCCTELGLESDGAGNALLEVESLFGYPTVPAIGVSWQF